MDFYNKMADFYDSVTQENARQEAAADFVNYLRDNYHIETALDAACGAGLFTLALARAEIRAIGLDVSEDLLAIAREKAIATGLDVQLFCDPMQKSAEVINAPVDAILCMGNSIPHLLEDQDLFKTFSEFGQLLKPGAPVVIHLLNYAKVLSQKERIVGVSKKDNLEFIRFYDFIHKMLRFNLLRIDWSKTPADTNLSSTTLRPWKVDELLDALKRAGFAEFETFGNLNRGHFDLEESDVLVLIAKKAF